MRALLKRPFLIRWALVFVVQFALTVFLARLCQQAWPDLALGSFSLASGDHFSYIGPMENLIAQGEYAFLNQQGEKVLAGRMPHYAAPYWLLRNFTGVPTASDMMVLLHVAVFALAVVLLGQVLRTWTWRAYWEYTFLTIAALSPFMVPYHYTLQPASVGASLLVITLCCAWQIRRTQNGSAAFALACTSSGTVVLVPYLAPVVVLVVLSCLPWRTHTGCALRSAGLALGVCVALLAPWWIRNARLFDRFFPFQQDMYAGYGYGQAELEMRDLLTALGEDAASFWEPGSLACLMVAEPPIPCTAQWPTWLSPGSRDQLQEVRRSYMLYQLQPRPENESLALASMDTFMARYAEEEPWMCYSGSRFRLLRSFLVHSGSRLLPVHDSFPGHRSYHLFFKLAASAAYWISLGSTLLAVAWAMVKRSRSTLLWCAPAIYLVLLFPIALGLIEPRYFTGAYLPGLLLAMPIAARMLGAKAPGAPD
jgi:hypothetical protein